MPQGIAILGSTGSIGRNALRVMDALGPDYEVVGLSAHSSVELLAEQARRFKPKFIAVADPDFYDQLKKLTSDLDKFEHIVVQAFRSTQNAGIQLDMPTRTNLMAFGLIHRDHEALAT